MTVSVRANYRLTGWNANQLRLRVADIMTAYGTAIDQQLKQEIQTPQFSWPRETKRRSGSVAGTIRNIVDTGTFLRSQRRDRPNATTLRFTWGNDGVSYAGYILSGVPGRNYPARDWIKPALDRLPLDAFFRQQWARLDGRGA
jgi:hypothetical protein